MNEKPPLVSVIINTHNRGKYLSDAINSVYSQTYPNYEIIVYDNASSDHTFQIVKKYDQGLRYFKSETFLPLGAARNNALEQARGEYICFLDSDDWFLPTKLEKQVFLFKKDICLVYSNSITKFEKTGLETILYSSPPPSGHVFPLMLGNYCIQLDTVMFRRSALDSSRDWWCEDGFSIAEEVDLFLRMIYKFPIAYIHEPLSVYRIHDTNISRNRDPDLILNEQWALIVRLKRYIPDFEVKYKAEIRSRKAFFLREAAENFWKMGKRINAFKTYMESFLNQPKFRRLFTAIGSLFLPFSLFDKTRQWVRNL